MEWGLRLGWFPEVRLGVPDPVVGDARNRPSSPREPSTASRNEVEGERLESEGVEIRHAVATAEPCTRVRSAPGRWPTGLARCGAANGWDSDELTPLRSKRRCGRPTCSEPQPRLEAADAATPAPPGFRGDPRTWLTATMYGVPLDYDWFAPGTAADRFWDFNTGGGHSPRPVTTPVKAQPVAADLTGGGVDDVLWRRTSPAPDVTWFFGSEALG